jgi:hypothetical protein
MMILRKGVCMLLSAQSKKENKIQCLLIISELLKKGLHWNFDLFFGHEPFFDVEISDSLKDAIKRDLLIKEWLLNELKEYNISFAPIPSEMAFGDCSDAHMFLHQHPMQKQKFSSLTEELNAYLQETNQRNISILDASSGDTIIYDNNGAFTHIATYAGQAQGQHYAISRWGLHKKFVIHPIENVPGYGRPTYYHSDEDKLRQPVWDELLRSTPLQFSSREPNRSEPVLQNDSKAPVCRLRGG